MFRHFILSLLFALVGLTGVLTGAARAQGEGQNLVWVQIEAHPNLELARERARGYSQSLADVNGFSLGGSWYGIVLGPYLREDAERVLQAYRANRQIPRDSYIAFTNAMGGQFWPEGSDVLNRGVLPPLEPGQFQPQMTLIVPQNSPEPSDETPAQARRSERLLSATERQDLQTALRAAGFYNAAIDGAFGAGTRRSMADWQISNGFEATGVLTSNQRKTLMDTYNAPLISVGMRRVRDARAGIEMDMPAGVVRFARYEPPFAHYDASTDLAARILLISQPGTQATLYGLYDIMQTLEIVPLNGPRERSKTRFTLEGRGKGIVSYTQAALDDGQIKGFTLIWPAGDEARRTRVLDAMTNSFVRIDGVLDPAAGGDSIQSVDLVSGLEVRKPRLSRSGFYIDGKGTVVTTADAVRGCTRITLDDEYEASVVAGDDGLGVAVLRPTQALAPMSVARFVPAKGRLQSDVTVAGFSYGGLLGAPTLTHGTLADNRGLNGEAGLTRLALTALPGDAGGPVIDATGAVLGMLLPRADTGRTLPDDVSFAADADTIRGLLEAAGLKARTKRKANAEKVAQRGGMSPANLTRMASGMTVLVSCWD